MDAREGIQNAFRREFVEKPLSPIDDIASAEDKVLARGLGEEAVDHRPLRFAGLVEDCNLLGGQAKLGRGHVVADLRHSAHTHQGCVDAWL